MPSAGWQRLLRHSFCIFQDITLPWFLGGKNCRSFSMSISGLSIYAGTSQYQWQQGLSSSAASSASSSQNVLSTLGSSTTSMASQISGMVELVQYAMKAMGLSEDSRVTFSQLAKYQQQLEKQFDDSLKKALEESAVADLSGLTFTLDPDGTLTAAGTTEADTDKAQDYLDEHPEVAQSLLQSLKDADIELTEGISFSVSSSGSLTLLSGSAHDLQAMLDEEAELVAELREGLEGINVNPDDLTLVFDDAGNLVADEVHPQAYDINNWLRRHEELQNLLTAKLEEEGIAQSDVSLAFPADGGMTIALAADDAAAIRQVFTQQGETGKALYDGLADVGIDPDITFSLQVESDGSVTINSAHADADKLRELFENNAELTKQYAQVQALSGIEDARAAMQINPTAMRTRLQMETIATSWFSSQSTSGFGTYSSGSGLSLLSGLNMNV